MLHKIAVISTMAAILLLVVACGASPTIETRDQAFDLVIDRLENSSFDGENCLRLVMELSEEAGFQGGPSEWASTAMFHGTRDDGTRNYLHFSIFRVFDTPGGHMKGGMRWKVYPDGKIENQHKYPPC